MFGNRTINIDEMPQHKRISSSTYIVDFFSTSVDGSTHHFLSHFHSDHYCGLKKSFGHPVFCSETTADLVKLKIGARCIALEMFKVYELDPGSYVQCIEAYHCPGAVCFLFRIEDQFFLHTGDFKAMECFYKPEIDLRYNRIYLDNTYDGFRMSMSQEKAIHTIIRNMEDKMSRSCLAEVVYDWYFCTYLVGKEKIFLSVAEYFNMSARVGDAKMKIYNCFSDYTRNLLNEEVIRIVGKYEGLARSPKNFGFRSVKKNVASPHPSVPACSIRTNWKGPFDRICNKSEGYINVISSMHLTKARLSKTFEHSKADCIVVFFGTGWRNGSVFYDRLKNGRILKKGIEVIYVPYSEHSSAEELKMFKERMKCDEFINTVNI